MASAAFAPRGTQFQHSPDGVTYTTVAEVIKIQTTGSKADLADVTNMDSASAFREYLATLVDSGEISLDTNFIPGNATQQILATDFNNQTLGYYKIVLRARQQFDPFPGLRLVARLRSADRQTRHQAD